MCSKKKVVKYFTKCFIKVKKFLENKTKKMLTFSMSTFYPNMPSNSSGVMRRTSLGERRLESEKQKKVIKEFLTEN